MTEDNQRGAKGPISTDNPFLWAMNWVWTILVFITEHYGKFIVAVAIIISTRFAVFDLYEERIYIQNISTPSDFKNSGITSDVFAQHLASSFHSIVNNANSQKEAGELIAQHQVYNFDIPKADLSLLQIKHLIQKFFGFQPPRITGQITCELSCENLELSLQLYEDEKLTSVGKWQLTKGHLLKDNRPAVWLTESIDPYIAAVHFYRKNNFSRATQNLHKLYSSRTYKRWADNLLGLINVKESNLSIAKKYFLNAKNGANFHQPRTRHNRIQRLAQSNLANLYAHACPGHQTAREALTLAKKLRPNSPVVFKNYAEMQLNLATTRFKNYNNKKEHKKKITERKVITGKDRDYLQRKLELAMSYYEKANDLDPSDISIIRKLATSYWTEYIVKIWPDNPSDKDIELYDLKNKVFSYLHLAHQLEPKNTSVLNDWAKYLINFDGKINEAQQKIRLALSIKPSKSTLHKRLGHIIRLRAEHSKTNPHYLRMTSRTHYLKALVHSKDLQNQTEILKGLIQLIEDMGTPPSQKSYLSKYKDERATLDKKLERIKAENRKICVHPDNNY